MKKIFDYIDSLLFYGTLFLIPLISLPIFSSPFVMSKTLLLVVSASLLIIIKTIKVVLSGRIDFSSSKFDFPILLLLVAFVLSTWFISPNKMDALILPGSLSVFACSIVFYLFTNQLTSEKQKNTLLRVLMASGVLVSLTMLLARLGLFSKIAFLPNYIKVANFTTVSSYLQTALFLGPLFIFSLGMAVSEKSIKARVMEWISVCIILVGTLTSIYYILPGKVDSPLFPDHKISWSVAVDTLKNSPLLGAGAGNYQTAFTRLRPITFNTTPLWAVRYSTASNLYLTIITETGLVGTAGLLLLAFALIKFIQKDIKEKKLVGWGFAGMSRLLSLVTLVVALLFFPASLEVILLLFVLISVNSDHSKSHFNLTSETSSLAHSLPTERLASRLPAIIFSIPMIVFAFFILTKSYTYAKAEVLFTDSIYKLSANKPVDAYNSLKKSIELNNRVDRYHLSYAQLNLALANAIASKATKDTKLSKDDTDKISQLVQQAIRENKAAVALNPFRANSWEALAKTYRGIASIAKDADTFAIQSYSQAILLDPYNPNLRIDLGGMFFAKKDYVTAVNVFELATRVKPDLANAHYNLALALRESGNVNRAIGEMSNVLSLVDPNSKDYEAAKKVMEDLEAKKKEVDAQNSDNLTAPVKSEKKIDPQIDLDSESTPPSSVITPTPVKSDVTVTPQITPTPLP